jgi:hypothetical protein
MTLAGLLLVALTACAVHLAPPPAPVVHPSLAVGSWLDASADTQPFTTFITIWISCDEPVPAIVRDGRRILWFASLFTYGPTPRSRTGYALRPDYVSCWQQERAIIRATAIAGDELGIHLLDEPEAVAYGDRGATYDPNLYNADITAAAAIIHADFPAAIVSINYGAVPDGLQVPAGLGRVALEAYDADWRAKLAALEALTPAPIWIMPRAFLHAGDMTDAAAAQQLRDQAAYAQTDPRVTGLYWFLWCCDDVVTGDKSFYSVSGGQLPLTLAAVKAIGPRP